LFQNQFSTLLLFVFASASEIRGLRGTVSAGELTDFIVSMPMQCVGVELFLFQRIKADLRDFFFCSSHLRSLVVPWLHLKILIYEATYWL
jgi:hypothetical protein